MATSSTEAPPADSIFAVMSPTDSTDPQEQPAGIRGPPSMPPLGMLIDRTSFDETDDYGVDKSSIQAEKYFAGPPVVMKDGKVRRRMRWRPKSMVKRRRPTPVRNRVVSSNASVMSTGNSSQSSRQSRKSLHSFASTETACINNKTKKNKKLLPLPRPTKELGGVATIGNEGDFVQARMESGTGGRGTGAAAVFAAADAIDTVGPPSSNNAKKPPNPKQLNRKDTPKAEAKSGNNKPTKATTSSSTSSPGRRPGLPPLFQRPKHNKVATTESPVSSPTSSPVSTPSGTTSVSSMSDDGVDGVDGIQFLAPVPVLSGEDVEADRCVDLRIRKTPSNFQAEKQQAKLEDGVEPLSVQELRQHEVEERQDKNRGSTGQSTSDDLPRTPTRILATANDAILSSINKIRSKRMAQKQNESLQNKKTMSFPETATFSGKADDEIRFSMSETSIGIPQPTSSLTTSSGVSPSKTTKTCPVDLDDGTFLEAEKNLQAIHEMASEHLRQGEYTEALEVFEEILRGQLVRYGEDHYRVGTALHNIGIVHMRRKDYNRAIEAYKEAVRVRKKALDRYHTDVAVSLAQLGVAFLESNKHRKAIGAFREALKIRRKLLGNDHPKVAKILNNIGCSLFELEELEVAKVAFEEALDIQRNLLRNPQRGNSLSEKSLLSIASTQSNIASIKLYCGRFDEACVDLEEALLVQQCVLGDDHPLVKRTQESLTWMESSSSAVRQTQNLTTVDLITQLSSRLSVRSSEDSSAIASCNNKSMLDMLYARLDSACGGPWDMDGEDYPDYEDRDDDDDISSNE